MRYIFFVNVGLGLLVIGLAIPMVVGWVKPNNLYGFRTAKTLSSEAVWYPANRFAGVTLILAGLVTAAGSVVLFTMAGQATGSLWSHERIIALFLAMLFVPLVASLVASLVYLAFR